MGTMTTEYRTYTGWARVLCFAIAPLAYILAPFFCVWMVATFLWWHL